jgi:hypothetical protein
MKRPRVVKSSTRTVNGVESNRISQCKLRQQKRGRACTGGKHSSQTIYACATEIRPHLREKLCRLGLSRVLVIRRFLIQSGQDVTHAAVCGVTVSSLEKNNRVGFCLERLLDRKNLHGKTGSSRRFRLPRFKIILTMSTCGF